MSTDHVFALTHKHNRSLVMLAALLYANTIGRYPTITELARAYDDRSIIPRSTLASRRVMVRSMMSAGFIVVHHIDDKDRSRYEVTYAGTQQLGEHRMVKFS